MKLIKIKNSGIATFQMFNSHMCQMATSRPHRFIYYRKKKKIILTRNESEHHRFMFVRAHLSKIGVLTPIAFICKCGVLSEYIQL